MILCASVVIAKDLTPSKIFKSQGSVISLIYNNGKLYAGTDQGSVDIFDANSTKLIDRVKLPEMLDFMGDKTLRKVYSVDILDGTLLFATEDSKGYRSVFTYNKEDNLTQIISLKDKLLVQKIAYVSKDKILLGLLGNELILFDIKNHKRIYSKQVSQSKFSDFAIDETKTKLVIADESGDIPLIEVKSGKILKMFKGENLDNIFQIDYKSGLIIGAGQDRKCSIYKDDGSKSYSQKADFLIYSAGLSPDGTVAGFAINEDNEISVFSTQTKSETHRLKGHSTTLTNMIFINNDELYSSSEDENILYWNLK